MQQADQFFEDAEAEANAAQYEYGEEEGEVDFDRDEDVLDEERCGQNRTLEQSRSLMSLSELRQSRDA